MADLQIQISKQGKNWVVVQVAGDAGLTEADSLDAQLSRLVKTNPTAVVFELSGLNFISSLGMGAILSFRNIVVRGGGKVRIASMQPLVLEAFRRARLDEMFEMHTTLETALA